MSHSMNVLFRNKGAAMSVRNRGKSMQRAKNFRIHVECLEPRVSETPIVINQDVGDQEKATVAWNGEHWLVTWTTPSLTQSPTYQRIVGIRVAPDGTVVDDTPIEVHNDQVKLAYYDGFYPIKIASNGQDWVVAFKNTYGNAAGAYAIRVAADGSIPVATPIKIGTDLPSFFDIAAAQDRYLIAWQDTPGFPGRGRLYTPDLQPIGGAFSLPGAEVVASDGTDFMVNWYARELRVTSTATRSSMRLISSSGTIINSKLEPVVLITARPRPIARHSCSGEVTRRQPWMK